MDIVFLAAGEWEYRILPEVRGWVAAVVAISMVVVGCALAIRFGTNKRDDIFRKVLEGIGIILIGIGGYIALRIF